ncbi:hypothetical protein Syun_017412 [Stephania yunnanensis]|uniref:Tim44-like domain-containing protein n=1 Tax=Stephania yunnanensis TaxID=152371 RepID=A0AAP0J7T5_9MAGN
MASRKLVRDFFLSNHHLNFLAQQAHTRGVRLISASRSRPLGARNFGVFNEFSKKVKGEAKRLSEGSVKELKDKAGELKEVKEDLKGRSFKGGPEMLLANAEQSRRQTNFTNAWMARGQRLKLQPENWLLMVVGCIDDSSGIQLSALMVSTNVKERISAATEEVKESLGLGKQDSSSSSHASNNSRTNAKDGGCSTSNKEDSYQNSKSDNTEETLYGRLKSNVSSASSKMSVTFKKLKDVKVVDLAKKGYSIVKDELNGNASKKRVQYASSASSSGERSAKTDIVVVPTKQSHWGKKWESFKDKMRGNPAFKRISGISEPVVTKGQEFAEDMRERWETSDNPVVHKIQDLNESVFGETATAISFKEIRRRDPYFSLPEFVAEVQDMIRPTLNAYIKGDIKALKKTCSPEVIERCKAQHRMYESQGSFLDDKVGHLNFLCSHCFSNFVDLSMKFAHGWSRGASRLVGHVLLIVNLIFGRWVPFRQVIP